MGHGEAYHHTWPYRCIARFAFQYKVPWSNAIADHFFSRGPASSDEGELLGREMSSALRSMQLVGNALPIAKRREFDAPIASALGILLPTALGPSFSG
jgi:hypothetical protein